MFYNSVVSINLLDINSLRLHKPTKLFSKIGAALSGSMPEVEQERGAVMLSLLQKVNQSLRAAEINNLVTLTVNDTVLFHDSDDIEDDLDSGIQLATENINSDNLKNLNQ